MSAIDLARLDRITARREAAWARYQGALTMRQRASGIFWLVAWDAVYHRHLRRQFEVAA